MPLKKYGTIVQSSKCSDVCTNERFEYTYEIKKEVNRFIVDESFRCTKCNKTIPGGREVYNTKEMIDNYERQG